MNKKFWKLAVFILRRTGGEALSHLDPSDRAIHSLWATYVIYLSLKNVEPPRKY
jgi:hypothetical protein